MPTVNSGGLFFGARPSARAQEGQCPARSARLFLWNSVASLVRPSAGVQAVLQERQADDVAGAGAGAMAVAGVYPVSIGRGSVAETTSP